MDLRALKYFTAVYEHGSFSRASRAQFIAQPSISAAIKQLEQNLSQKLFNRFARGVTPTQAGHQLYPLAKQLLGQADAIQERFALPENKIPCHLGLVKGLGVERMSSLLKQFTAAVEGMDLTLVPAEEQCDARIISDDMLNSAETFLPMWDERYLLAIPQNHQLSLNETIRLKDLEGLALIQRSPCEGWTVLQERLQHVGVSPDIRARIQTIEYAIGLVKAGLGCAYIPVSREQYHDSEIVFRPISGLPLTRRIGLAYSSLTSPIDTLQRIVGENI